MDPLTDTEKAVLGDLAVEHVLAFFDAWLTERLGSPIAEVRFRSGRIDAVWGIALDDERLVVLKAHRPPVDLDHLRAALDAQRLLHAQGYPAPAPLAGPDVVDGTVLTAETLVPGSPPDGHDPTAQRILAEGLVRHVELLKADPDLLSRTGPGPSWCRYQDGPWPTPHDTIVDLSTTPPGAEWLDHHAAQCTAQILEHRAGHEVVVGHADWYAGNALLTHGELTGVVDWELVADTEAVLAGFAAAACGASATGGGGLSTPEEVAAFLHLVEDARGNLFSSAEWLAAAGAAAWILAFNARWQLGLVHVGLCDEETIELVHSRGRDYLALAR